MGAHLHDVERQVKALVATSLQKRDAHIPSDASLENDLGFDSLAVVTLILAVEDEFELDIPDEDMEQINTVRQLISYVMLATAAERGIASRVRAR